MTAGLHVATEQGGGRSGRPVVLVHGTMDRSSSFGRVVRGLDGVPIVRYDRRGYGRSVDAGPPRDFDQQVDDLLAVVEAHLRVPPIVFGHSYGGTIALAAAQRHPDLLAAVLAYECPMPWRSWWPADSAGGQVMSEPADPAATAERFVRRLLGDERWAKLPRSTKAARRAEGVTLVAEIGHLRSGIEVLDPGRISVPVVAARGELGAEHHRRSMEAIASEAVEGQLVEVAGAGHGVHLTHPHEVVRLLVELTART